MKFLIEKRNALVEEINNIFVQAETEKRALTDEEQETFTTKTNELKALDKTIEAKKRGSFLDYDGRRRTKNTGRKRRKTIR